MSFSCELSRPEEGGDQSREAGTAVRSSEYVSSAKEGT